MCRNDDRIFLLRILSIKRVRSCNQLTEAVYEEYKYNIQILPTVLRNLAEANQDNTLRNFIKLVHEKMDVSFFNPDINLTNLPPNSSSQPQKKA